MNSKNKAMDKLLQIVREEIDNLNESNNIWLKKLKKDLLQNKYNFQKVGLYSGLIKDGIENLLKALNDYDM